MATLTAEVVGKRVVEDDLSSKVEFPSAQNSGFLTRQNFGSVLLTYDPESKIETPVKKLIGQMAWLIWETVPDWIRYSQLENESKGWRPPRPHGKVLDRVAAIDLLRLYVTFHGSVPLPNNEYGALNLARNIVGYKDEHGKWHEGFRESRAYKETSEFYPPITLFKPKHSFLEDLRNFPEEYPHSV